MHVQIIHAAIFPRKDFDVTPIPSPTTSTALNTRLGREKQMKVIKMG